MSPQAVTAPAAEDGAVLADVTDPPGLPGRDTVTYLPSSTPYRVQFVKPRPSGIRGQTLLGSDTGHIGARVGNR